MAPAIETGTATGSTCWPDESPSTKLAMAAANNAPPAPAAISRSTCSRRHHHATRPTPIPTSTQTRMLVDGTGSGRSCMCQESENTHHAIHARRPTHDGVAPRCLIAWTARIRWRRRRTGGRRR